MSPESEKNRVKFFALIARHAELALLPPAIDDLDLEDTAAVAEARLVIDEMNATQAAINKVLTDERRRARRAGEPWAS